MDITTDDSDDEMLMMGYHILKRRRRKRMWVHDINSKREELGEYHKLVNELRQHPDKFYTYFRMSKEKFDELVEILTPTLHRQTSHFRRPIGVPEQLAICLRFLSTGDSFTTIAYSFRCGISTVSDAVYDVFDALWESLNDSLLPFPTEKSWIEGARRFEERWNFPHCIGAIDGKHVIIEAPPNLGSLYFNYKKSFSIVLLAVVDADYLFTAVDIGSYGSSSDSGILNSCPMGVALEQQQFNIPRAEPLRNAEEYGPLPYVIVGDEGFPLKDDLLRPYSGKNLPEDKRIFNYRLSRARRISENAFGLLTQRWRIYNRKLRLHPDNVTKVVKGTIVLHNFIQKDSVGQHGMDNSGMPQPVCEGSQVNAGLQSIPQAPRRNRPKAHSMQVRNLYKDYFSSEEGAVPWQYSIIRGER